MHSISNWTIFNIGMAIMRFSEGGGSPATPTQAPCAYNPEPLWGHERVRGKGDGCVDEVGGGGGSLCPA